MKDSLPRNLGSFIWHFLKGHKGFVVSLVILSMMTGLWGPFNSFLIKYIIDGLSSSQIDDVFSFILWPAILLVVNHEVHNLCGRTMGYLNYKHQPVIKNQIIMETFRNVHNHTQQFFQDNLAGRISNHINGLADHVERIIHDISRHLIREIVLISVAFVSLYSVHPKFFLALFVWLVIFVFFSLRRSNRFVQLSELHGEAEALVSGQMIDSIANASNVRIFAGRDYELSYLEKTLLYTKKTFQESERFGIKLHYFQGLSLSIMLGVMLYFLIELRMAQKVTAGDFAFVLGLSMEVGFVTWGSLEEIDELNKSVGKCKQSLSRLFVPVEITDKESATDLLVSQGKVTFSSVNFYYKGTKPLFQNNSVTIAGGQKVGLVGPSGGGKSTFVHLILRLYDVTGGSILIDGQDIRDVTQDSLRGSIGLIPQDPSLFHRSLMENIRYGRIDASDKEVIKAAKRAHTHEFIMMLPQGYDSLVGERGIKLSGGQRQRIAIARAILKNAPILILDEATSQLDSVTESSIQESLWQLMQGKTAIVIAHRLSTLLHMDRILVFDRGKIVEDGTHGELLTQKGLYKTLWDAQVGGFFPDMIETARVGNRISKSLRYFKGKNMDLRNREGDQPLG
jgi:ATP-binding cassette subfamily B protein